MDLLNVSHEFLFNSIIYYTGSTNPAAPNSIVSSSQSPPSASSGSHVSRTSTPATELSSVMTSPVFAPIPTAESMRRRQQSDAASAEIGNRLLKGWAMLADECPSVGCYGIPLVRPPKAGGGKDPKKVSTSFVADGSLLLTMKLSSRSAWFVDQLTSTGQTVAALKYWLLRERRRAALLRTQLYSLQAELVTNLYRMDPLKSVQTTGVYMVDLQFGSRISIRP